MNSTADSPSNLDPERLRSVALNFSGLQGLNLRGLTAVVFGATFATMQMAAVYWRGSHWAGLVLLACGGLFAASLVYAPRYYRWRFGWVQPRPAPVPHWLSDVTFIQVFIAVFIAAAAYFLFWTIIDLAGHAFPGLLDLMPLFVWSVAFCFSLWLLRSMDRQKLHHVLLTFLVVIAIAFITFYPLWLLLDARQFLFWKTLNAGSLGLGFIVLGLYDHIMLLRMMPKRIAEDDHDHE